MFYQMRLRTLPLAVIVLYILFSLWPSSKPGTLDRALDLGPSLGPWTKGRDLHPAGLQVVDMADFRFVLNHDICGSRNIALLTVIKSSIPNKDARAVVRETWGRPALPGTALVFLVGVPGKEHANTSLEEESTQHGDIVQGGFLDTYRNLTYKTTMGLLWVTTFCQQAEVVVMADDDSYIDLYGAQAIARRHARAQGDSSAGWVLGPVKRGAPVVRAKGCTEACKWSVTEAEVEAGLLVYPDYCNGIFYMLTVATAVRLVAAAKKEKYFYIDDVFLTGFLRQKLNITLVDTNEYQMFDNDALLKRKAEQSPDTYMPDFVNGLLTRGEWHRTWSTKLENYARQCYEKRCLNNIYSPQWKPTRSS